MFSLKSLTINALSSLEVQTISEFRTMFLPNKLDLQKYENIKKTMETIHNSECGNCEPLLKYGLVCQNCLYMGHDTIRPESNMLQVYIDEMEVIQTDINIYNNTIREMQRERELNNMF